MPVIKRGIVKKKSKPKRSSFTGKGLTLANLEKSRNERKEAEASKSALLSRTLLTMQQRREEQYYDEDFTMGDEDTEDEADSLTGRKTDLVPEEIETVHPDGTIEVLKVPIGHIKEEEEPIISDAPADEHSDLVRARRIARFSTLFATAVSNTDHTLSTSLSSTSKLINSN